jgi:hypothetical protein
MIIILFPLSAQKNKDVLYLKNGSIINGKLVEVSNNTYKIRTSDGSLFIFQSSEVEKMLNEVPYFEGRKKSGAGFALEAGLLFGVKTEEYTAPFSFNMLGNYTTNTTHIFGIGSGVEYIGQAYMPLFVEYKQLFSDRKTTPFVFTRIGNLFHLQGDSESSDSYTNPYYNEKTYHGGFSFTLGTGISWIRNESETYLSFAYRNAHISYEQFDYNNHNITYKTNLNRLEVKFGFKF